MYKITVYSHLGTDNVNNIVVKYITMSLQAKYTHLTNVVKNTAKHNKSTIL